MRAWTRLLSRLLAILLLLMVVNGESAGAMQKAPRMGVKQEGSPIMGEADESDIIPMDEDDEEGNDDEEDVTPLKPQQTLKFQKGNQKNKAQSAKEKMKERAEEKAKAQAAQKRKKLMEDFKKAEEFHKTWFNMPFPKIKSSLEKLVKFCKVACVKSQCRDGDVANNCHLMCPESTTKQCADPLKQEGNETLDTEDFIESDDEASPDAMGPEDNLEPLSNPSIDQDDSSLKDADGEGG